MASAWRCDCVAAYKISLPWALSNAVCDAKARFPNKDRAELTD
jgi:hypothetical protein